MHRKSEDEKHCLILSGKKRKTACRPLLSCFGPESCKPETLANSCAAWPESLPLPYVLDVRIPSRASERDPDFSFPFQIKWFKEGRELSKYEYTMQHSDGVVTMEIVDCKPSDSGNYRCVATNALGKDETSCVVIVEGNVFSYSGLVSFSKRSPIDFFFRLDRRLPEPPTKPQSAPPPKSSYSSEKPSYKSSPVSKPSATPASTSVNNF